MMKNLFGLLQTLPLNKNQCLNRFEVSGVEKLITPASSGNDMVS